MVKAALPLARRLNLRRSCRLDSKPPTLLVSSASTVEPISGVPMTTTCVYPRQRLTCDSIFMHIHRRWGHRLVDRRERVGLPSAVPSLPRSILDAKALLWSRCGQSGVRIRRHPWPPLVAKAGFWVSDQMRPTAAGAVYPAAAADGIHGREVNFGWSMFGARGLRPSTRTLTTRVDRRSRPPAHRRYNCPRRKPTIRTPVRARPVGPLGQVVCRHRNSRPSPRHGSRYQRSPDRTGCDAVHSNTLLPQQLRQARRKVRDGSLGRRVRCQCRGRHIGVHRRTADYR